MASTYFPERSSRQSSGLQKTFALLAFVAIALISTVSGSFLFRYLSQHLLERDMVVSAEFVQSVAALNNPEPYFSGSNREEDRSEIEQFFRNTTLIPDVLQATVYDNNQTVIWSDNSSLIGKRFDDNDELEQALRGEPVFALESLEETDKSEHAFLPADTTEFVENYLPIWNQGRDRVLGVLEIYKAPKHLSEAIARGKYLVFAVSLAGAIALYLSLFWVVRRASRTIDRQDRELKERIDQLSRLLHQNSVLRNRIQQASSRAVATNERFLRRIGSDLHDGPAQSLGYALLRLDAIKSGEQSESSDSEFEQIRRSLESALGDIRTLSAGLVVPELAKMSLVDILQKVIRDHRRQTGFNAALTAPDQHGECPLPVKICAYRFVQEALNNVYQHAPESNTRVEARYNEGISLVIEVSDTGPGFDPEKIETSQQHGLGLAGMRERIESLGGELVIQSKPGQGTVVRATMPLDEQEIRQ